MRLVPIFAVAALTVCAASSFASFSGNKPESPMPSSSSGIPTETLTARQQAERLYADAYDEIAKANEAAKGENPKAAEKKYKKALDRALRATEYDTTYHEAWNLVGYSSRKLGKLHDALAAYARCLRLRPDYAAAREYLGEAYLEMGNLEKAKEQLAMLEKLNVAEPLALLRTAIETYEKAHPAAPAAPAATGTSGSN